eukprot:Hpha_TRINITY_DN30318_c0_g1::TRINITY_DN30318_c0_g1_i1::g.147095::m.147095
MLRILQYNIQSCTGMDGTYSPANTAEVVKSLQPDLLAVQEIEIRCNKDCYGKMLQSQARREAEQPAELAQLTEMEPHYVEKTKQFGGSYGTAAYSRLPIIERDDLHLKSWDTHHGSNLWFGKLAQSAAALTVHPPGWSKPVLFISTHLGCDASGKEQAAELQEIFSFVDSKTRDRPMHVVISGDFNTPPFYSAIKNLPRFGYQDCWANAEVQRPAPSSWIAGGTHPSNRPAVRLDYVITSLGLQVESAQVVDTQASDHLPLFVILREGEGRPAGQLKGQDMRLSISESKRVPAGTPVEIGWSQNLLRRKVSYSLFLCVPPGGEENDCVAVFVQEGFKLQSSFEVDESFQFGNAGCVFLVLHDKKNKPYQDRFGEVLRQFDIGPPPNPRTARWSNSEFFKSFVGDYLWDYGGK